MNRELIRQRLREDSRVRQLISIRAHEIYSSREEGSSDADNDWYMAEHDVIEGLIDLMIAAQEFAWRQEPGDRAAVTLIGYTLASNDTPSPADLTDARYYTIGLSYLTGMFQIGQGLEEDEFIRRFGNDPAVLKAILYRLRTSSTSPYYTEELPADLRLEFDDEAELNIYLERAEQEAKALYGEVRRLLMG